MERLFKLLNPQELRGEIGGAFKVIPGLFSKLIKGHQKTTVRKMCESLTLEDVLLSLKPKTRIFFDEVQCLEPLITKFAKILRTVIQTLEDPKEMPWFIISGSVASATNLFEMKALKQAFLGEVKVINVSPLSPEKSTELLLMCLAQKGVISKQKLKDDEFKELVKGAIMEISGIPRALLKYCQKINKVGEIFSEKSKLEINMIEIAKEELQHIAMFAVAKTLADGIKIKISDTLS
ncbi:hypothetical protein [Pyrococcus kukulkanii]|uniref:hypothetical protein n=1 Tax=Pyrococcus kukulkanii TaxID=1609559 RepID=UPI00356A911B